MGASLIIIGRIRSKHSVQVPFPKNQDVIQAFPPEGPDQALNIWVLPRRSWRDRVVPDSHRSNSTGKGRPVGAIIVAYQIGWCRLPRECLYNLLRQPFCRRVPGHREPEQLSSTVAKDEKRKQALERQSWDQAKINRRNGVGMIAQKCPLALRWRSAAPGHVLGDRRLGDLKPELQQFTMDARGAP
jgi:hypothetical protein